MSTADKVGEIGRKQIALGHVGMVRYLVIILVLGSHRRVLSREGA